MHKILPALFILLLASCQESPPAPPAEPLRFTGPAYTFNVTEINVVEDYLSPRRPPNVEYLADITPAQAVKQWAGVKLAAAGHANTMEVDIKDASVMLQVLPKQKTGLEGMFTTEQTEKYDGTLEVEIKIYNQKSPLAVAHVKAKVNESLTLPESATPVDRERLYHRMTIDLMNALEPELDANIHRYLGSYLL